MSISETWFARAQNVMPGGVNSPVRAFRSVGGGPRFIRAAKGSKIYDVDGNEYLDYIGSWGPMILGHAHEEVEAAVMQAVKNGLSFGACSEPEVRLAELVCGNIPHVEMIRMVSSGTEAVMSALRLARGYTRRDKVIKFAGCYHGHSDSMLIKAGSGALTFGVPDSAGVTKGAVADTLSAKYNDLDNVRALFAENKDKIACVIVEPVAANMGVAGPRDGFLQGLRDLCDANGSLLIFDEVITGFRLCFGGAGQYFGVIPDLVTYGKIIGGGMPVGAYGGKKEIMSQVSPLGPVYQAGTLSGNPVAMAAGIAALQYLLDHPQVYDKINALGEYMAQEIRKRTRYTVNQVGSLLSLFFTEETVGDYDEALRSDTAKYAAYFHKMLEHGIYLPPAQFEAVFISDAHSRADVDHTVETIGKVLQEIE
ncbi:MAG: glutamate-1-semialdehyde 2,1-aminomutase [Firmicutes bacterium]|nr:glutamate-1-semialdehyde 2,1-aminomutase [Bacillota bacterium]